MTIPSVSSVGPWAGGLLMGLVAAFVAWRQQRKERRESQQTAANLTAGHLNTLAQQLMSERTASEARFARMQERADKLADKVETLEREGYQRQQALTASDHKIEDLQSDVMALIKYTGDLESIIRTAGLASPERPTGLIILRGRGDIEGRSSSDQAAKG